MKTLLLFAAASLLAAQDAPPLSNAHLETRAICGRSGFAASQHCARLVRLPDQDSAAR